MLDKILVYSIFSVFYILWSDVLLSVDGWLGIPFVCVVEEFCSVVGLLSLVLPLTPWEPSIDGVCPKILVLQRSSALELEYDFHILTWSSQAQVEEMSVNVNVTETLHLLHSFTFLYLNMTRALCPGMRFRKVFHPCNSVYHRGNLLRQLRLYMNGRPV